MNYSKQIFSGAMALLLTSPLLASDIERIKGTLVKSADHFKISTDDDEYKVIASEVVSRSLPSLEAPSFVTQSNGEKYAFEFAGEIVGDEFHLQEVPVLIAGAASETGTLTYNEDTESYEINGRKARFGYTKLLNGYQFDEISKDYFTGKEVLAEGNLDEDGTLIIQALTPTNLFDATIAHPAPQPVQTKLNELGAWDFLFWEMIKNKNSQSEESFRSTVYEDQNNLVESGDSALIITLSGRQGDSFGSVNGHMVAGLGEVRDDMTLRAEVSNAYVTNGKDILSGNTSLTNYYSHTVQGQNNYRPTYTLIAYGVDKQKLKQFRDSLEESHIKFRTRKLDITPQFNCTTETIKALEAAGIKGNYKQYDNLFKGILTSPLGIPLLGDSANTIHYALKNDQSRFHPRAAYESFIGAFLQDSFRKSQGVKRVDFVYYSQIPSKRPVGGMSLGNIFKVNKFLKLYEKYEVNEETKLSPENLRPILEEKLSAIPYR